MNALPSLNPGILDLDAPVVFFPVRHHSPAAARLVRSLALQFQPKAILIEGPADFNTKIHELALPHQLPIAIYSYVTLPNGNRRGAFYPYCVYSPEWQALQVAQELDIPAQFIDLPWADLVQLELAETDSDRHATSHRYADDRPLRQSQYIQLLGQQLGIEGLDNIWDHLFEIDPDLSLETYLERCHQFCFSCRALGTVEESDLHREAYMTQHIHHTLEQMGGPILVVTGGFHSHPLYEAIEESQKADESKAKGRRQKAEGPIHHSPFTIHHSKLGTQNSELPNSLTPELPNSPIPELPHSPPPSLTPYSYERLDGLTGYNAGMTSPGFYHHVWHHQPTVSIQNPKSKIQNPKSQPFSLSQTVLADVVQLLRDRDQPINTADLIAVESMANGLAALRGHAQVWRQDLLDGIVGALIKESVEQSNPFLSAVYDVLRGDGRGQLAPGTSLPPLVQDIQNQLTRYGIVPDGSMKQIRLELRQDLDQSRVLHQLRVLGIAGFHYQGGTDFSQRDDLVQPWESWELHWSPMVEGSCIEAAIYGSTLTEAAEARLLEQAQDVEREAEAAALLLLDASLMGLSRVGQPLRERLLTLIRADGNFLGVTKALGHLLYLYRYDDVLGAAENGVTDQLLGDAYHRGLWLLDTLGKPSGNEALLVTGVRSLLETAERCGAELGLDRQELMDVFQRVSQDRHQLPLLRGATIGGLWTLDSVPLDYLEHTLNAMASPQHIGDFLTGLFALAREVVQRYPDLLRQVDQVIQTFDDPTFLAALPALRLAFTYFTPREKHTLAQTLTQTWTPEGSSISPLSPLSVNPEIVAQVMAFEAQLQKTLNRYGLRGSP